MNKLYYLLIGLIAANTLQAQNLSFPASFKFGKESVAKNAIQVNDNTLYSPTIGYGLVPIGQLSVTQNYISSNKPFYFEVNVPEGNYNVDITFAEDASATVKAESRRLIAKAVDFSQQDSKTLQFTVNARTPKIDEQESIRLKTREIGYLNWDHKLTLEFNGNNPAVKSIKITPAQKPVTIFLAGNSTVTDQEEEPWASWGQMFPAFFRQGAVVANYAESGETLKAFQRENRLKKIESLIKKGDYLFIEFAHNDQKPGGNHVEPFTTYQQEIMKFVEVARSHGTTPVLVTSMHRRSFNEKGEIINTLEEYPEAVRQLAQEEQITLIDLNSMSKIFYETLGVEDSKKAFVHYPANTFPNQDKALADNSHFSTYGAYQLARCIVSCINNSDLELKKYLRSNMPLAYDPSQPDAFENWDWPLSPVSSTVKPDGN